MMQLSHRPLTGRARVSPRRQNEAASSGAADWFLSHSPGCMWQMRPRQHVRRNETRCFKLKESFLVNHQSDPIRLPADKGPSRQPGVLARLRCAPANRPFTVCGRDRVDVFRADGGLDASEDWALAKDCRKLSMAPVRLPTCSDSFLVSACCAVRSRLTVCN